MGVFFFLKECQNKGKAASGLAIACQIPNPVGYMRAFFKTERVTGHTNREKVNTLFYTFQSLVTHLTQVIISAMEREEYFALGRSRPLN